MKRLRSIVGVMFVLGLLSAAALLTEYLALCDIGKVSAPVVEWYVVGVCMVVTAVFVIATLIMLGVVLARPQLWNGSAVHAA